MDTRHLGKQVPRIRLRHATIRTVKPIVGDS